MDLPASSVTMVSGTLNGPGPTCVDALTEMLYSAYGCSPVIVCPLDEAGNETVDFAPSPNGSKVRLYPTISPF